MYITAQVYITAQFSRKCGDAALIINRFPRTKRSNIVIALHHCERTQTSVLFLKLKILSFWKVLAEMMQKLRLKYSFVALLVLLSFRGGGTEVRAADSVLLIVWLVVRVWLWALMIHWGERRWCSAKGESLRSHQLTQPNVQEIVHEG